MEVIRMRLSVDVDSDRAYPVLRAYYNMAYFFNKVFVRQSSSRGFHLEAYIPQEISFQLLNEYRLAFGDDNGRIAYDQKSVKQGKPKQVLFGKKKKKLAGKWYLGLNALPLPFKNSQISPTKFRS